MTAFVSPLAPVDDATVLLLPGLEVDNLLAFLALLGLLRAIETARPAWRPRASWAGTPWRARLHLAQEADEREVAIAAGEGIEAIAAAYDVDGRANVNFGSRDEFHAYARRVRDADVGARLASALTAEIPAKRDGGLYAAPLVMMFGQGHQNFLDRLVAVARGDLPNRMKKRKPLPNFRDPLKVREALFAPWRRDDDADAFRWDPGEDQRYALRYDDPSAAGAAPTVHGANRLAAIGFLSFACAPARDRVRAPGTARERGEVWFVWPVWTEPHALRGVEALLSHPDVLAGERERVRVIGVIEIMRARRVANGKFMNVTRARPVSGARGA